VTCERSLFILWCSCCLFFTCFTCSESCILHFSWILANAPNVISYILNRPSTYFVDINVIPFLCWYCCHSLFMFMFFCFCKPVHPGEWVVTFYLLDLIFTVYNIQGGTRKVIPLIVHVTQFYYYKNIWHLVQN